MHLLRFLLFLTLLQQNDLIFLYILHTSSITFLVNSLHLHILLQNWSRIWFSIIFFGNSRLLQHPRHVGGVFLPAVVSLSLTMLASRARSCPKIDSRSWLTEYNTRSKGPTTRSEGQGDIPKAMAANIEQQRHWMLGRYIDRHQISLSNGP